jgi:UDP-N-acetylmuramoylalanine--D-glutamate ligase
VTDLPDVRSLAVLGLGRSGVPAALLASRRLPGVTVTALDEGRPADDDAPALLGAAGVAVLLGRDARLPAACDLLVKSPGVPNESPVVREAQARGVPVWSEVELARRFLPNRLVAITGTNGKTTTTELTGAVLRDAGVPVAVAGNVGHALSRLPDEVGENDIIVAELSSFQLEHIERLRPDVGVLLNLTPDHIDRHGSQEAYVQAKLRLVENQVEGDLALFNADDPASVAEHLPGRGRRGYFSAAAGPARVPAGRAVQSAGLDGDRLWVAQDGGRTELCPRGELALKGDHNLANSLAAAAAAAAVGVPAEAIATTLRTFPGVPHRLEVVGTVGGVVYVNDSKATNTDATLKALTAYTQGVHLILGGYDKGAAFDELAVATEGRVAEVLLIGATAAQLAAAFAARAAVAGARPVAAAVCADLGSAVAQAARAAIPGDVVLLSPACASWDQYRNYEERGEHFRQLVGELGKRS